MMAFPGMLVAAAKQAGMKVPPDPDKYNRDEFPHFQVFCFVQLCRPVPYHGVHWDNAKIIAALTDDQITKVSTADLVTLGLQL